MRISDYQLYHVRPRYLLLKIETDDGLYGWGEPTLEGQSPAVEAAIRQLMRLIKGEDPRRIEHLWQRMYRGGFYRGGPVLCSAISGIEQALWDILGKSLNVPVYQLLGGRVRDRIRLYGQIGSRRPEILIERFRRLRAKGMTMAKFSPWWATRLVDSPAVVDRAVNLMAAVREEAGNSFDLALDCHGRLSPAMAIRFARALEPYHPMFLEEPCLPENVDTMVTVARSTSIPIATGERLCTRWGFREVLEKQAAAIIQPDLSHIGGIFEARKVAAMAEVYYAAVAPHCPLSAVSLAACLQLAACIPNFLAQEHVSLGEKLLVQPFVIQDGHVRVPDKPGLGIEVDEGKLAELLYDGHWTTPELRHDDGSVADW
ncbi:MAG: galactonate dehydratase [Phycisphaerae bacterium]